MLVFLLLSADVGADAMLLSAGSVCIDILLSCQNINQHLSVRLYALFTHQTPEAYKECIWTAVSILREELCKS